METKKVKLKANYTILPFTREGIIYDAILIGNSVKFKAEDGYDAVLDLKYFEDIFNNISTTLEVNDNINPTHYSKLAIQPIEFITKNKLGYNEGNVIKYICRYKEKNGVEDLKKAKQYIDFLIDEYETKSNR
jgi:hypothetical protein